MVILKLRIVIFIYVSITKHRVGIQLPTIEVRFEHLNVEAEAYEGNRALPTMFNFFANMFEVLLKHKHAF